MTDGQSQHEQLAADQPSPSTAAAPPPPPPRAGPHQPGARWLCLRPGSNGGAADDGAAVGVGMYRVFWLTSERKEAAGHSTGNGAEGFDSPRARESDGGELRDDRRRPGPAPVRQVGAKVADRPRRTMHGCESCVRREDARGNGAATDVPGLARRCWLSGRSGAQGGRGAEKKRTGG
jgi:hypothetical protein